MQQAWALDQARGADLATWRRRSEGGGRMAVREQDEDAARLCGGDAWAGGGSFITVPGVHPARKRYLQTISLPLPQEDIGPISVRRARSLPYNEIPQQPAQKDKTSVATSRDVSSEVKRNKRLSVGGSLNVSAHAAFSPIAELVCQESCKDNSSFFSEGGEFNNVNITSLKSSQYDARGGTAMPHENNDGNFSLDCGESRNVNFAHVNLFREITSKQSFTGCVTSLESRSGTVGILSNNQWGPCEDTSDTQDVFPTAQNRPQIYLSESRLAGLVSGSFASEKHPKSVGWTDRHRRIFEAFPLGTEVRKGFPAPELRAAMTPPDFRRNLFAKKIATALSRGATSGNNRTFPEGKTGAFLEAERRNSHTEPHPAFSNGDTPLGALNREDAEKTLRQDTLANAWSLTKQLILRTGQLRCARCNPRLPAFWSACDVTGQRARPGYVLESVHSASRRHSAEFVGRVVVGDLPQSDGGNRAAQESSPPQAASFFGMLNGPLARLSSGALPAPKRSGALRKADDARSAAAPPPLTREGTKGKRGFRRQFSGGGLFRRSASGRAKAVDNRSSSETSVVLETCLPATSPYVGRSSQASLKTILEGDLKVAEPLATDSLGRFVTSFCARLSVGAATDVPFAKDAVLAALLDHPNVGKLHDVFEVVPRNLIVLKEYLPGSLRRLLNDFGGLPEDVVQFIARDVLEALSALHSGAALSHAHPVLAVVHNDVRAENVSLSAHECRAKLVDFSSARIIPLEKDSPFDCTPHDPDRVYFSLHGSWQYFAPERIAGHELKTVQENAAADVWALGLLVYELATGKSVAETLRPRLSDDVATALRFIGEEFTAAMLFADGDSLTEKLEQRRFIESCLVRDPRERATAADLLKHQFLQEESSSPTLFQPPVPNFVRLGDRPRDIGRPATFKTLFARLLALHEAKDDASDSEGCAEGAADSRPSAVTAPRLSAASSPQPIQRLRKLFSLGVRDGGVSHCGGAASQSGGKVPAEGRLHQEEGSAPPCLRGVELDCVGKNGSSPTCGSDAGPDRDACPKVPYIDDIRSAEVGGCSAQVTEPSAHDARKHSDATGVTAGQIFESRCILLNPNASAGLTQTVTAPVDLESQTAPGLLGEKEGRAFAAESAVHRDGTLTSGNSTPLSAIALLSPERHDRGEIGAVSSAEVAGTYPVGVS